MGRIFAGGGWMDAFHYKAIVELSDIGKPHIVMIPTAQFDNLDQVRRQESGFKNVTDCTTSALCILSDPPSLQTLREHISQADIVYALGGDTGTMMKAWRRSGLDRVLREAYTQNIVFAGASAGANCWFRKGISGPLPKEDIGELPIHFKDELDQASQVGSIDVDLASKGLRKAIEIIVGQSLSKETTLCWYLRGRVWVLADLETSRRFIVRKRGRRLLLFSVTAFIRFSGLDLVPSTLCTHYADNNITGRRKSAVFKLSFTTPGIIVGMEDKAALLIKDHEYCIISTDDHKAFKIYRQAGRYIETAIQKNVWNSLNSLTVKEQNVVV